MCIRAQDLKTFAKVEALLGEVDARNPDVWIKCLLRPYCRSGSEAVRYPGGRSALFDRIARRSLRRTGGYLDLDGVLIDKAAGDAAELNKLPLDKRGFQAFLGGGEGLQKSLVQVSGGRAAGEIFLLHPSLPVGVRRLDVQSIRLPTDLGKSLAATAAFLASLAAQYITGTTITVDGGAVA